MTPTAPHPEPLEVRHEKSARRVVVTWEDGHNTGIYSFRLLRSLCPCTACGGERR